MTDAMLTIEPPPPLVARMPCAARRERANGAIRFRSSTFAKVAVRVRSAGAVAPEPALLMSPSSLPWRSITPSISRSRSASSVTSQTTGSAFGISCVSAWRRSARRAARTGTPPAAPTAPASCAPRPELAPVMTTTRPANSAGIERCLLLDPQEVHVHQVGQAPQRAVARQSAQCLLAPADVVEVRLDVAHARGLVEEADRALA